VGDELVWAKEKQELGRGKPVSWFSCPIKSIVMHSQLYRRSWQLVEIVDEFVRSDYMSVVHILYKES